MVVGLIFSVSVSMLFLVSGVFKIISFKKSAASIINLNIMPEIYARVIGACLPFIEVGVAVILLLEGNSMFVNLIAIGLIMALISINYKAIYEGKQTDCFCLGTLINTKIGYGGLVQCLLLLLSLIPNLLNESISSHVLENMESIEVFFILFTSFLWMVSLIIIRKSLETFFATTNDLKVS